MIGCEEALEDWASLQKRNKLEGKPISIMKVAATEEWKQGIQNANVAIGGGKEGGGENNIQVSEEHDWTYYTDFNGIISNDDDDSIEWKEESSSGIDMAMLSDTTVPILFFDEVKIHPFFS